MRPFAIAAATAALACGGEPAPVTVVLAGEDRPRDSVELTFLPYDPRPILDSLAAYAPHARPEFSALEREIHAFAPPDSARLRAAEGSWPAFRDSLQLLSDSLERLGPGSPEYGQLYAMFRQLYARQADELARRERAVAAVYGDMLDLAARAQAAADTLRAWEAETFADYDRIAEVAVADAGREPVTAAIDSTGRATVRLEEGQWWAVTRRPLPHNPFLEHVWQVPFTASGWLPVTVPLRPGHADRRWRH